MFGLYIVEKEARPIIIHEEFVYTISKFTLMDQICFTVIGLYPLKTFEKYS
jgi:hypothetical protein